MLVICKIYFFFTNALGTISQKLAKPILYCQDPTCRMAGNAQTRLLRRYAPRNDVFCLVPCAMTTKRHTSYLILLTY